MRHPIRNTSLLLAPALVAFCLFFSFPTRCQTLITVEGIVLDSATAQLLPYVLIQIKGEQKSFSTGDDATFFIPCLPGDTLVFTRLGYNPYLYAASADESGVRIYLSEHAKMLNNVTIYDNLRIMGADDWKKDKKINPKFDFRNPHQNPSQNTIPTFGPGMTIKFGGKDKTKAKQDEISRTQVYRATVEDPAVREKIMNLYSISEETFLRKLETFNKEVPDAVYITSKDEIISMWIQFFALKEP